MELWLGRALRNCLLICAEGRGSEVIRSHDMIKKIHFLFDRTNTSIIIIIIITIIIVIRASDGVCKARKNLGASAIRGLR